MKKLFLFIIAISLMLILSSCYSSFSVRSNELRNDENGTTMIYYWNHYPYYWLVYPYYSMGWTYPNHLGWGPYNWNHHYNYVMPNNFGGKTKQPANRPNTGRNSSDRGRRGNRK